MIWKIAKRALCINNITKNEKLLLACRLIVLSFGVLDLSGLVLNMVRGWVMWLEVKQAHWILSSNSNSSQFTGLSCSLTNTNYFEWPKITYHELRTPNTSLISSGSPIDIGTLPLLALIPDQFGLNSLSNCLYFFWGYRLHLLVFFEYFQDVWAYRKGNRF